MNNSAPRGAFGYVLEALTQFGFQFDFQFEHTAVTSI